ncbi:hypothetical protein AA0119_g13675 [Alternaria tenuissima]|uniref:Uncharacterized protein n=1 Tax=Alternaria tenuissima TaxID=119927 RepID=A0ABY0FQJ5_9PLEO|nr:hypothetical protein AA0119_g13675 [Alternaria tenuissima]
MTVEEVDGQVVGQVAGEQFADGSSEPAMLACRVGVQKQFVRSQVQLSQQDL